MNNGETYYFFSCEYAIKIFLNTKILKNPNTYVYTRAVPTYKYYPDVDCGKKTTVIQLSAAVFPPPLLVLTVYENRTITRMYKCVPRRARQLPARR